MPADGGPLAKPADDLVLPFQIERPGLRGRLVRLGPAVEEILSRHNLPDPVARLLAETLALAAALAGALKYEGVFTLQVKGDGPVRLMVADVTSDGAMRGYAQLDPGRPPAGSGLADLVGKGYLAFTVDQGADTERYQGIVELLGASLTEAVHHYFRQSEQLKAALIAASAKVDGRWRAGALMLQQLPEGSEPATEHWDRALAFLGTGTAAELTAARLPAETLLYRLFHEDGVRVWPAHRLSAGCRCSRGRVETVLRSLPLEDLREHEIDGRIAVTCEFCNTTYLFTHAEVTRLHGD